MAGRGLPDLRPASNRELIKAWRIRATDLELHATALRAEGDIEGAEDCEKAAQDYRSDADNLDYFGGCNADCC